MRLIVSLMAVLILVCASAAQDAAKKEMAQLEGEWSMVSGQANGQPMPQELVKTGKRSAKDGETTISIGGKSISRPSSASTRPRTPRPSTTP
jgi:hypothetical protein